MPRLQCLGDSVEPLFVVEFFDLAVVVRVLGSYTGEAKLGVGDAAALALWPCGGESQLCDLGGRDRSYAELLPL